VFDTDQSTLIILANHYAKLARLSRKNLIGRFVRRFGASDRSRSMIWRPVSG
jgi:hypothetical protein